MKLPDYSEIKANAAKVRLPSFDDAPTRIGIAASMMAGGVLGLILEGAGVRLWLPYGVTALTVAVFFVIALVGLGALQLWAAEKNAALAREKAGRPNGESHPPDSNSRTAITDMADG